MGNKLKRFWVSWESFDDWMIKPLRYRHCILNVKSESQQIASLVNAKDEDAAWNLIQKSFKDIKKIFCIEKDKEWLPLHYEWQRKRGIQRGKIDYLYWKEQERIRKYAERNMQKIILS